jgi:hypothetical protein
MDDKPLYRIPALTRRRNPVYWLAFLIGMKGTSLCQTEAGQATGPPISSREVVG